MFSGTKLSTIFLLVFTTIGLSYTRLSVDSAAAKALLIKQGKWPTSPDPGITDVVMGIILVLVGITGYAIETFPHLSPAFGGGKKQCVVVVAKSDQVATLNLIGFKTWQDRKRMGPLDVLYESQDNITILPAGDPPVQKGIQSIKLKKDMFDAIFYVESNYTAPTTITTQTPTPTSTPSSTPVNPTDVKK